MQLSKGIDFITSLVPIYTDYTLIESELLVTSIFNKL